MPTSVQTDLWLVGVLAWQLLVGIRPDLGEAHAGKLLSPHRYSPEVPIALSRAIMPALDPDPAGRPESAQRMLEAVAKVPVYCGWEDVAGSSANSVRAWRADEAGRRVTVEIFRRARGGFAITGKAPPGSHLAKSGRPLRRPMRPRSRWPDGGSRLS